MKTLVMISAFDTTKRRMESIEDFFASKGINILNISSNYSHHSKTRIEKSSTSIQIEVPEYSSNISFARIYSHLVFSFKVYLKLKNLEFDYIYINIPPNSLMLAIYLIKLLKPNIKIITDVLDVWPEALPSKLKHLPFIFYPWKWLRDSFISKSDFLFVECQYHLKSLPKKIHDHAEIVYLSSSSKNVTISNNYNFEPLVFIFIGSMGHIIDIDLLAKFLNEISKTREIAFDFIGSGEFKKNLFDLLSTNITINDYGITYDQKFIEKKCFEAHFGLNVLKNSTKVGLTTKSIDYFSYGLPIINTVPEDTYELVKKNHIGLNISSENLNNSISTLNNLSLNEYLTMRTNTFEVFNELFSENAFRVKMNSIFEDIK